MIAAGVGNDVVVARDGTPDRVTCGPGVDIADAGDAVAPTPVTRWRRTASESRVGDGPIVLLVDDDAPSGGRSRRASS